MKSLLTLSTALVLLHRPARAQVQEGEVAAGVVATDIPHLETFIRFSCSPAHTGVCAGFEGGIDWASKRGGLGLGADVGYSLAFGVRRRTSLNPRVGVSLLDDDVSHTGYVGITAGVAVARAVASDWAWTAGFNWRHYPGFVLPTVFLGVQSYPYAAPVAADAPR